MQSPKETSNLRQKTIKGVIWSAIQSWGRQLISSFIFFILARILGPEAFGLVASAWIFLAFIDVFLDQGFSTAIIQRHEIEDEHLNTAFWINLLIGLSLTGLSFASAGLIAHLLKQPQLTEIIHFLSFVFVFSSLSGVQEAILKRKLEFKSLAIRELAAVSVSGIVGITMALRGYGVWSLVWQQLVNALVQVLILWWTSSWRPGLKISLHHFQDLFAFGISMVGIRLIDFLNRRADDFLISYFLGSVALGYYTVAYRLLLILLQLLSGVSSQVLLPSFSRLQLEPEKLRQAFYSVIQLTSIISFPSFIGLSVLAPEFVEILFGKQWLPSAPVMQILAFIGILESMYFFYTTVIMAVGESFERLRVDLINVIANLIGFAIAVQWGIVAVATSFVIRGYLLFPLALLLLRKLIHIEFKKFFSLLAPSLLASLIMSLGLFLVKEYLRSFMLLPFVVIISVIFGIIIYTSSIMLLSPKLFQEFLSLIKSVRSTRLVKEE
jgi:O-antigen/teichoic acid export membrane protein